MKEQVKVFVCQCIAGGWLDGCNEGKVVISDEDKGKRYGVGHDNASAFGVWLTLREDVIEIDVEKVGSEQIADIMITGLRREIAEREAKHFTEMEALRGQVAKYQSLAAPVEGEVIRASDYRPAKEIEAEDGDYSDLDHFPF